VAKLLHMRTLLILWMTGTLLAATISAHAQGSAADEQAIREVLADFSGTLNQKDFTTWSRLFVDDADFVVITGKYLKGRNEITTYHTAIWAGVYKDSHQAFTSVAIRFIRPEVAVVHADAEITYNSGKDRRTGLVTFVLTKQNDRWLIATVQNTQTGGSPATPVGGLR
jgi:uncharacterized protein (TIGR02246 family)